MKKVDKSENLGSNNVGQNLDKTELTVKEVANIIEETPNVVRNWMKELKDFIPLKKNDSGYNVFDEEALERMKLIKQLHRDQNYSIKQITHYFVTDGASYKPIPKKGAEELLAEELNEMKGLMKDLLHQNRLQEEFNKKLVEKLDNQQRFIEESLKRRDEQLLSNIRDMQESARLIAASKEQEEEKKGFFARLFKK